MTNAYRVLGQVNPSATSLTTLHTVAASTSVVASTLCICNQGVSGTFRVAVRPAGAAIDPKHYLNYDSPINANDSIFLTIGATLATTDIVSVYASHANMSFNLFGTELT